jgi:archaemetzincin
MKIGLLPVGQVNQSFLLYIQKDLARIFPDTTCSIIKEGLQIPEVSFDGKRNQYHSNLILNQIRTYADQQGEFQRILGVIDVDIFVPELNYVFGEAYTSGKVALISLFRLKPQFYSEAADKGLLLQRAVKEAVHELGHTYGLKHCPNPTCVMYFSNSIADTDKKQSLFCDQCIIQKEAAKKVEKND